MHEQSLLNNFRLHAAVHQGLEKEKVCHEVKLGTPVPKLRTLATPDGLRVDEDRAQIHVPELEPGRDMLIGVYVAPEWMLVMRHEIEPDQPWPRGFGGHVHPRLYEEVGDTEFYGCVLAK